MATSITTDATTTTLNNNGNAYLTVDTNDIVSLTNPLPLASGGTGSATGAINLQTEVASTSGTSVSFTGIPSGVKRVTVMFADTSLSGTDDFLVQLGDAGGIETTGYISSVGHTIASSSGNVRSSVIGCIMGGGSAGTQLIGTMTFSLMKASTFKWVSALNVTQSTAVTQTGGGSKTLSAELTQLTVIATGSDTFDAGSVNISWEF